MHLCIPRPVVASAGIQEKGSRCNGRPRSCLGANTGPHFSNSTPGRPSVVGITESFQPMALLSEPSSHRPNGFADTEPPTPPVRRLFTDSATPQYRVDSGFVNQFVCRSPFRDREPYVRAAPMSNLANAKTPMLIQHGAEDRRVPLSNAMELYRGLKEMNVPVELFIFPGMGHPITRPRENHAVMHQNLTAACGAAGLGAHGRPLRPRRLDDRPARG